MERCALALMAAVHSTTASGCQHARESAAERYLPATSSEFKLSKQHMDAMSVRVRARVCVCVFQEGTSRDCGRLFSLCSAAA